MASVQFPYPRKTSDPQPFVSARASSYTNFRRRQSLKRIALYIGGVVLTIWLLTKLFGGGSSSGLSLPAGTPKVVIVTTIDPKLSESYKQNIKDNRRDYAERHGYVTFFPNTTDYDLTSSPSSWSTVPALRHAMTLYPNTPWLFYLSSTALIMNPRLSLHHQVLDPSTLSSLMITDKPVVPPDSVIKTFSHLKPERVNFILSQDKEGLAGGALLIRAGDWAKFFLDAWYDPLYRSYNFQKAEGHALEHIVQWHGTILARLALIPQRVFNSYTYSSDKSGSSDTLYQEGDFVANFHGCQRDGTRNCEDEMRPLITRWRELKDGERRR
ncbi:glycosyltransferase family 34 protein [Polychaeton citri CBS 116435]|uniref:Glycosyltransferase family 34 protein n=1 Tax=Polychaeton citri CBS 116435 TaxID=1314669 RepID=A0A9P4QD37_9PEZI|nr:glycosyltransferase family 34 protein [Polychaeton citri CBS 116435]